ncbi:MAG: pyridoxal kinase PdxY [Bradyrhizobiaceae bacterium]|nr:pyridoxal kinase PdxY [Bradyrhizobiaceae bacterium]
MNLLSVQSHVAYGHVGNSAAVFALQRLGCEVWPVHTVQFSNHPGYGAFRGRVFEAAHVDEVVHGIAERGALSRCDGVLSGYLGAADVGAAILDAVALTKAANPQARYCCDPVIGDAGPGEYVRAGIAEFLRERALPAADVITPNQFELDRLSGQGSATRASALAAAENLRKRGPAAVLVTSLHTAETPAEAVDVIACDARGRYLLRTPLLPVTVNGAGDAAAALFFFHYLRTGDLAEALARTVSSIFGLVRRTARGGTRELLLIEAQEELIAPSQIFRPEPI